MSKTGRYVYDPETDKIIKVSDRAKIKSNVFMPRDTIHSGHRFENLGNRVFANKDEKRKYMKENHIAEL